MSNKSSVIPCLDGLRGVAALWVFLSHVQILTGSPFIPIFSEGGLAVDLFMLLSGFLMALHYADRQDKEPWHTTSTWWYFWTRRFFRITPAYYLLLFAALLIGPHLGGARDAIASLWPNTATLQSRYDDHSVANIFLHLTYIFGALPQFSFNTPLPDWSIGLEMQFYLVFPFLMLMIGRFGAYRVAFCSVIFCIFLQKIVAPHFFSDFAMPSFLPMKLYMFMAGILMALARSNNTEYRGLLGALGLVGIYFIGHPGAVSVARLCLVVIMFALVSTSAVKFPSLVERLLRPVRAVLSGRAAKFSGDTAYGFYLIHLLLVLPLAGYLARNKAYASAPAFERFAMVALTAGVLAYFLAWLLHITIEQPGIKLGKSIIGSLKKSRTAMQVPVK